MQSLIRFLAKQIQNSEKKQNANETRPLFVRFHLFNYTLPVRIKTSYNKLKTMLLNPFLESINSAHRVQPSRSWNCFLWLRREIYIQQCLWRKRWLRGHRLKSRWNTTTSKDHQHYDKEDCKLHNTKLNCMKQELTIHLCSSGTLWALKSNIHLLISWKINYRSRNSQHS